MTNPEFTDADFTDSEFDVKDISSILKDIDNANIALDALDVRADKLNASIAALLKAQSLPNPFQHVEAASLEDSAPAGFVPSSTATPANSVASTDSDKEQQSM
ncbi:hypothetical protein BG004_004574 [Podila humilis]|nr:hypothetical protein BG004_004574 [Podila humilis]